MTIYELRYMNITIENVSVQVFIMNRSVQYSAISVQEVLLKYS
jgi:hypothetical protein